MKFNKFEEFEANVINVTHSDHQLSPELHKRVKDQFALNMQGDGATFLLPIRVDILQKKVNAG